MLIAATEHTQCNTPRGVTPLKTVQSQAAPRRGGWWVALLLPPGNRIGLNEPRRPSCPSVKWGLIRSPS
eukprot:8331990-Pyramimonas_sp.AAC.1